MMSYHIILYRIVSCHITSHHITSCHVISCSATVQYSFLWFQHREACSWRVWHQATHSSMIAFTVSRIHHQEIVGDSHEIAYTPTWYNMSCHNMSQNRNSGQYYYHDVCVRVTSVRTYMSVFTLTTLGIFNPFKKHFTSGIPGKNKNNNKNNDKAHLKSNTDLRGRNNNRICNIAYRQIKSCKWYGRME